MKLNKLIKKINKENAPPDGWKAADAVNKAINWDKLKDPETLKQLKEIIEKLIFLEEVINEKKNRKE